MSWQAYVDTNLVGSGKITKAVILGLQGGVWASSPGFELSSEEQNAIIAGFKKPDQIQASGIRAAGVKYFTIQAGERSIYGKQGLDGIVIVQTKQAALVCVYKAPIQAAEATPVAEGLADYLISVNY